MKRIEQLRQLKQGQIVPKQCLYYLKVKGYIWDYSKWGYLEGCRIKCEKEKWDGYTPEFDLEVSSKGACKIAEKFDTMFEKYRQSSGSANATHSELLEIFGHNEIEIEGMKFRPKYFDGCFMPYLVKC